MMGARVSQWMVDNIHNNINIHTYIYVYHIYLLRGTRVRLN